MTPPAAAVTAVTANYINHITIVGDESWSMSRHAAAFVKVFDNLVQHLAQRSKEHGQETRITVYLFSSRGTARCVTYDKDVLRMPSIAGTYKPNGNTALIDAAQLAITDLRLIPQKYGQHAFLTFCLTDGQENDSAGRPGDLYQAIITAPDNETYAAFVPDQRAVFEAKQFGFPKDNISVWDTSSAQGVEDVGAVIRQASDTFMTGRAHGVHGYSARTSSGGGLFRVRDFSAADVTSALSPLTPGSYELLGVDATGRIDETVARLTRRPYAIGSGYYQFTKPETIQAYKKVAIEVTAARPGEKATVYAGTMDAARGVLGLPDSDARVYPNAKPGITIFVQSTAPNRKLLAGTRVLVLR